MLSVEVRDVCIAQQFNKFFLGDLLPNAITNAHASVCAKTISQSFLRANRTKLNNWTGASQARLIATKPNFGTGQVCIGQVCITQFGTGLLCIGQVCVAQVCTGQIGTGQIGTGQIGTGQIWHRTDRHRTGCVAHWAVDRSDRSGIGRDRHHQRSASLRFGRPG